MMADVEDSNEEEKYQNLQRLKAAVHYTVGQICDEIGSKKGMRFSKGVIAALTELTFNLTKDQFARDLEVFAKHAKRTTINEDDVKLLVRNNAKLGECVQRLRDKMTAESAAEKSKKPRRKRGKPEKKSLASTSARQNDGHNSDDDFRDGVDNMETILDQDDTATTADAERACRSKRLRFSLVDSDDDDDY